MAIKIKWVEVVVSGGHGKTSGNCTTYTGTHSEGKATITNTLGKQTSVDLTKEGSSLTVCDDTGVATVKEPGDQ